MFARRLEALYPEPRSEDVQVVIDRAREDAVSDEIRASSSGALASCGERVPDSGLVERSNASPRGYVVREQVPAGAPIAEAVDRGAIELADIPPLLQTEDAIEPDADLTRLVAGEPLRIGQVLTHARVSVRPDG